MVLSLPLPWTTQAAALAVGERLGVAARGSVDGKVSTIRTGVVRMGGGGGGVPRPGGAGLRSLVAHLRGGTPGRSSFIGHTIPAATVSSLRCRTRVARRASTAGSGNPREPTPKPRSAIFTCLRNTGHPLSPSAKRHARHRHQLTEEEDDNRGGISHEDQGGSLFELVFSLIVSQSQ